MVVDTRISVLSGSKSWERQEIQEVTMNTNGKLLFHGKWKDYFPTILRETKVCYFRSAVHISQQLTKRCGITLKHVTCFCLLRISQKYWAITGFEIFYAISHYLIYHVISIISRALKGNWLRNCRKILNIGYINIKMHRLPFKLLSNNKEQQKFNIFYYFKCLKSSKLLNFIDYFLKQMFLSKSTLHYARKQGRFNF